ncbi:inner membrane metabolite transport protein YdfJ [Shimwellia blattae DSM 4481 = NBRC 105725]|uniref:Inner membrane metabolite transport protein YdfJ n=1 Tax=Shimwellia blattae (strain ATCC 29907 / DSM 4481 / JCM 1650 / NBRC 105725 / CDC 9005-74) TaxID=630626 RepID=I2B9P9_SHIBC|nr:inner membrane metabolite transport protein YdfJ [Shimwellia blattae DSM 4481 = NBRC 105725]GAB82218.1 putative major facilitator superfamily transporter YdfJ [Shimwellia blattae DSM 4481 = NBRC 105725]VDY64746.1 Proline porter II [Shimwellia blattae]VEC22845.1 Proline porter II [Shimwellia blattae]
MDFQLYSLGAALVFHEIFFPEQSAALALILAMGTYGAGYIARIVGAFIFGRMGDRVGRKKVLFITITMMGICTTLIGVLPTYAQIGIFAPLLLVTLRIIQGLGAGAEISGAGTMLAEYAPRGRRGIISSLVAMGTNCGTLTATAIWAIMFFSLEREELVAWGWRIPFLASVVVMIFAIWLRLNLKESPVFEQVNEGSPGEAPSAPPAMNISAMFKSRSFWLATGLRFGQAGNSGLIQTFLAGYMVQQLLFDKSIPTDALMISSVLGFITIPLLGWLSDKYGRRWPYIILNISAILLAYPMLSIIVDNDYSPGAIMTSLVIIHNVAVLGLFALENITMAEMFGSRDRFTRMAIAKEAGGLVAVGFGPVLAGIFCTMADAWWPIAVMIICYSVIGLIAALAMPEVGDRDLSHPDDAADQPRQAEALPGHSL